MQLAAGDEAPPNVIEPNRLAECGECSERIRTFGNAECCGCHIFNALSLRINLFVTARTLRNTYRLIRHAKCAEAPLRAPLPGDSDQFFQRIARRQNAFDPPTSRDAPRESR